MVYQLYLNKKYIRIFRKREYKNKELHKRLLKEVLEFDLGGKINNIKVSKKNIIILSDSKYESIKINPDFIYRSKLEHTDNTYV